MSERTITMTVYAIEADLIDATSMGEPPESRFLLGPARVSAQGQGERHIWNLRPDQRCWIGDRVTITIIEDDPESPPQAWPMIDPPPLDKRGRARGSAGR